MAEHIDIKALRETLKISQSELARQAGVNLSTVWRWENEGIPENGPARAFLEHLASTAAQPS